MKGGTIRKPDALFVYIRACRMLNKCNIFNIRLILVKEYDILLKVTFHCMGPPFNLHPYICWISESFLVD